MVILFNHIHCLAYHSFVYFELFLLGVVHISNIVRLFNLKIILFQLVILPFLFSCNSSSSSSSSSDSNSGSYFVKGGFGLFANGGNGVKYGNFEL